EYFPNALLTFPSHPYFLLIEEGRIPETHGAASRGPVSAQGIPWSAKEDRYVVSKPGAFRAPIARRRRACRQTARPRPRATHSGHRRAHGRLIRGRPATTRTAGPSGARIP